MKSRSFSRDTLSSAYENNKRVSLASARLVYIVVFLVLMIGTITVVAMSGGTHAGFRREPTPAEAAELAELQAERQRLRQHQQQQQLLKEAKYLLHNIDAIDERIEGAKKVLARFSQADSLLLSRKISNNNNNNPSSPDEQGAIASDQDGGDQIQQPAHFPVNRYEELRRKHQHLKQYHDSARKVPVVGSANDSTATTTILSPVDSLQANDSTADTTATSSVAVAIQTSTIFLAIASHRQSLCAAAISNIFRHAHNPRRVYMGLVEVRGANDPTCLPEELTNCQLDHYCLTDHIRVRRLDAAENRGLAHARYLATLMYRGQDYVMFAAMPTFLAPDWDIQLIGSYVDAVAVAIERGRHANGEPQVVLSSSPEAADSTQTYPVLPLDAPLAPPASTNAEGAANGMMWSRTSMVALCRAAYDATAPAEAELPNVGSPPRGVPSFTAVVQSELPHSQYQPWVTTKFLFANATLLRDVPLDPHLVFIEREVEEDALYSARLWAEGWDAYSPRRTVAFQWLGGEGVAGTLSADVPAAQYLTSKKATILRIQYLLHALHKNSQDPIVPDDVILQEVIVEASSYGVKWNAAAAQLNQQAITQLNKDAWEGQWIPPTKRTLDLWYRFAGLNVSSHATTKEWCRPG